jgi:hypothetical protein
MFEDFSFTSSSNEPLSLARDADDTIMPDCDGMMISPLSSRCPSPSSLHSLQKPRSGHRPSLFRRRQPPTSTPSSCRRLSIGALTQRLYAHALGNEAGSWNAEDVPSSPDSPLIASPEVAAVAAREAQWPVTPPETDHDGDGYHEYSPLSTSIRWRSASPFSITSAPSQNSTPDTSTTIGPPWTDLDCTEVRRQIRLQRQHLSRLQCNVETGPEASWMALLVQERSSSLDLSAVVDEDDCHPSCLPPDQSPKQKPSGLHHPGFWKNSPCSLSAEEPSPLRRRMEERKSTSGSLSPSSCHHHSSHRVEKPRLQRSTRSDRDLRRKSDQGLRRRSLVSRTLARMALDPSLATSHDPASADSDFESS